MNKSPQNNLFEIYREAGEELITVAQSTQELGLVLGTWGNLSVRCRQSNRVIITPSGIPFEDLTLDDLVIMDETGQILAGHRRPSTETPLHLEIYQKRPDVQAIVHTHSVYASAFAVARTSLPPILEELAQVVGGSVSVSAYAQAGTPEMAQAATQALGKHKAVFLANHGLVGVGEDLKEAVLVCKLVEKGAQVYLYAGTLGKPAVLTEAETQELREKYLTQYGQI